MLVFSDLDQQGGDIYRKVISGSPDGLSSYVSKNGTLDAILSMNKS